MVMATTPSSFGALGSVSWSDSLNGHSCSITGRRFTGSAKTFSCRPQVGTLARVTGRAEGWRRVVGGAAAPPLIDE